ncbi:hypothetical protein F4859DRAFT_526618 [Xylaria cf. heliscus]|nr:hypothetical protein F4859DRAFT_526618 [Xylaria cf. heliscus]
MTQTPDCDSCARLRDQVNELLQRQNNDDISSSMQSVRNERRADLEADLSTANAEVRRQEHFLRIAEEQANQQRAEMHSLREELRLAREHNDSSNDAAFRRSLAAQQELERLRQLNAQLTAANVQQLEQAMLQKKRALTAERELDVWADKIRGLVNGRNELQHELESVRARLRHQERRASAQREGKIRAEVEVEELRRPRTTLRREREAMFT